MNKNKNNSQKQDSGGDDRVFMLFAIGLLGAATWYQKGDLIRFWFYQNLMAMTFYAFLIVAALVAYAIYRMKKKNQGEIDRMRALQSVRPSNSPKNYYERRGQFKR